MKAYELVIAFSAMFISLISLGVAICTLRTQRKHNQLSLRPVAYISKGDYENNIFVRLNNYGSGPMFIDSFTIQNKIGEFKLLVDSFGDIAGKITWDHFMGSLDGRVLAPGKEFTLIECSFDQNNIDVRDEIRSYLASTILKLDYKCTYEVKQKTLLEELTWFGRH